MSTAAVSSSSIQPQQYFQQRDSELKQLAQALQSGNLTAASKAFSKIQNLGQTATGGNEFRVSQRQSDFNAIGAALQNGDLAGAQAAFEQLRSTVGPQHGAVDPPRPNPAIQPNPASVVSLSSAATSSSSSSSSSTGGTTTTSPTATGNEIVLNLGNVTAGETITIGVGAASSGGGEQLTIGVSGQAGVSPENFTLNLGPNSGQQIVLNLLNSTNGTTSSNSTGGVSVTA